MKVRIALLLIILAALSRLLPHPVNFTPLGAIGLFGAAYFQRRWMALLVPFAALFCTDLFLNNVIYRAYYPEFQWITSAWIYLAFALVMLVGWLQLRQKVSVGRIVTASLSASVVFFLVSNFSTWAETNLYPKTLAGLSMCYAAGLPYFGNTVLGDLCFSAALFGGYAWVARQSWALGHEPAVAVVPKASDVPENR
ncbi:MAG: hypothetical protein IT260_20580 [Saprospiraceae bacterium]|nr:hypothetical protein [Saprospiraceae bacterium]